MDGAAGFVNVAAVASAIVLKGACAIGAGTVGAAASSGADSMVDAEVSSGAADVAPSTKRGIVVPGAPGENFRCAVARCAARPWLCLKMFAVRD